MNLSDLPDARIRKLARSFRASGSKLSSLLREMLTSAPARKLTLYNGVQRELAKLRGLHRQWAAENLPYYYVASRELTSRLLERVNVPTPRNPMEDFAINTLNLAFTARIDSALSSLGALAGRILRASDAIDAIDTISRALYTRRLRTNASPEAARAEALREFSSRLEKFPLTLQTITGASKPFALDYYVGLVASAAKTQAETLPARVLGPVNGFDLVRVSSNPSMHGDFCDGYAGKIFSLSGTDARFPPIVLTPNAGPPFHPWCAHTLSVVMPWEDLTNETSLPPYLLGQDSHAVEQEWKLRMGKSRSRR